MADLKMRELEAAQRREVERQATEYKRQEREIRMAERSGGTISNSKPNGAAVDSKYLVDSSGLPQIDDHVEIWWDDMSEWYSGIVSEIDSSGKGKVFYEDGEQWNEEAKNPPLILWREPYPSNS